MVSRRNFLKLTGSLAITGLCTPAIITKSWAQNASERMPSRFDFREPLNDIKNDALSPRLKTHAELLKERFGPADTPIYQMLQKNAPKGVTINEQLKNLKPIKKEENLKNGLINNQNLNNGPRNWINPTPEDMRYLDKNAPKLKNGLPSMRSLWIRNPHTKEEVSCVFWNNGVYDNDAYAKICVLMRDWREKIVTAMDPLLMHIIWTVQRDINFAVPVNINSAYRSLKTNTMLAKEGAAQNSQHLNSRAIDIAMEGYLPRNIGQRALDLGVGGVGFYPTFTHIDTAGKRYW